jgi:hypothetical protein
MCLQKLVKKGGPKFKLSKDKKGYYGWKIYKRVDQLHAHPEYCGLLQPVGYWINERQVRSNDDQAITSNYIDIFPMKYPKGFHVYIQKRQGNGFSKKVYIKNIVARGYSADYPTIVCKEIFIPKPRRLPN